MKKTIIILMLQFVSVTVNAQWMDTIYPKDGRVAGYYYSTWYDQCEIYDDQSDVYVSEPNFTPFLIYGQGDPGSRNGIAKPDTTKHPMAITGIGVWEINRADRRPGMPVMSDSMKAEYIHILQYLHQDQGNEKDTLVLLATIRWDTATPKRLMLPKSRDSLGSLPRSGYLSCELYEVELDTPVVVHSLFYMVGTYNNNIIGPQYALTTPTFTRYARIMSCSEPQCRMDIPDVWSYDFQSNRLNFRYYSRTSWGLYMPKVDFAMVDIQTNDPAMGTVDSSDEYSKWTYQTFTATPKPRHRFVQWNDGVTDNPRTVYITQDTSFTAYFVEDSTEVSVVAESDLWPLGFVEGDGTYFVADTVTLHAKVSQITPANMTVRFSHWNDGDTVNPRQFIVTKDTAFTAYFAVDTIADTSHTAIAPVGNALPGLFTLTPNPTTGEVQVIVNSEKLKDKSCTVTVLDAAGHEVLRTTINSQLSTLNLDLSSLPAGTYFVTLSDGANTATQKLILKNK